MSSLQITRSSKELLNIYFTAGYPEINSLPTIMTELEKAGVDMVEIGIPYSDPIGDGPTIQNSNEIAISNGISIDLIFDQIATCQTNMKKIVMCYFNSVFMYGLESFCKKCHSNNIQSVIVPDLPLDLYLNSYQSIFEKYNLKPIFLITPQTPQERINKIDQIGSAFIYVVSSSSTTGTVKGIQGAKDYLERIQKLNLKTPLMIGFNISTKEDFDFACNYASGGIIGSKFIQSMGRSNDDLKHHISRFIQSIKPA